MKTTISVTVDTDLYFWAKAKGIKRSELFENTLREMRSGVKKDDLEAKYKNILADLSKKIEDLSEENKFLWERVEAFQNEKARKW